MLTHVKTLQKPLVTWPWPPKWVYCDILYYNRPCKFCLFGPWFTLIKIQPLKSPFSGKLTHMLTHVNNVYFFIFSLTLSFSFAFFFFQGGHFGACCWWVRFDILIFFVWNSLRHLGSSFEFCLLISSAFSNELANGY